MAEHDPRVLAIDAGGTMTDTFIVDERRQLRRRQGADDARGRVGRLHGVRATTRCASGTRPRRRPSRGSRRGSTQRHRDAEPAAIAQGAPHRRDRHRRPGGLPADRARDPDLPRLLLLRPPPPRDPLPQRAAGPARPGEGRPRADRRVRAPRSCRCASRTPARPRPSCSTTASRASASRLLFCYRNAEHELRVGEIVEEEKAEARRSTARCPVFVSSELYPLRRDLPRLNSTLIEAYAAEPSRGTLQRGPRPRPRSAAPASSCG